jgi:archaellum component FlaC
MERLMMRNSSGQKDAMFTLSIISFVVVTLAVLAAMFDTLTIFGTTIDFAEPNVPLLTLYLGTCFSSYVFRRTTKDKLEKETTKQDDNKQYLTVDAFEEAIEHQEDFINNLTTSFNEYAKQAKKTEEEIREEIATVNKTMVATTDKIKSLLNKNKESLDNKLSSLVKEIQTNKERIEEIKPSTPEIF